MTTIEEVQNIHKELTQAGFDLISRKGNDYSGAGADTFKNLRLAAQMGIVESPQAGVLVRICDKIARLSSLKNPHTKAQVTDEKIRDTILDTINYAVYFYMLWVEDAKSKGKAVD